MTMTESTETRLEMPGEPKWPLVAGSLVPASAAVFGLYTLAAAGGAGLAMFVGLAAAIATAKYFLASFILSFPVLAFMAGRGFSRSAAITYSFVTWKISAQILSVLAWGAVSWHFSFLSSFSSWLGVGIAMLVSYLAGVLVIELPHKITMNKPRLLTLIALDLAIVAATWYLVGH